MKEKQETTIQPSEIVEINGKRFEPYLAPDQLRVIIQTLATQLNEEYEGREVVLIAVLKGAFIFCADLVRELNFKLDIEFLRLSSYGAGMKSSGKIKEMSGLKVPLHGKDVLIVEDIVDTGLTLDWLRDTLGRHEPTSLRLVTLLFKEEAFKGKTPPEYVGQIIPNHFVVGYGLDFAEKGRDLKGVFKVISED